MNTIAIILIALQFIGLTTLLVAILFGIFADRSKLRFYKKMEQMVDETNRGSK